MARVALALALALVLTPALAGCLKKGAGPEEAEAVDVEADANQTAELPDGRGESAGLLETNKTEEGVGGVKHEHDYWKGKETVILLQEDVFVGCPPCVPDGEGTQPKSVGYVKLGKVPGDGAEDAYALVYEGADRVDVLIDAPLVSIDSAFPSAPHPAPPKLFLQFRSAADSEWQAPVEVTYGTVIPIAVTAKMTDMPHSINSLWVFRLTTDRPEPALIVPMTITVHRGVNVVDWPGHPDFYVDAGHRVVMQQHVTTHMSGLESFALYDQGGTWARPEKLISWGTSQLHVFMNITKVTNAYNAEGTGFFLEAHNATIIGPEVVFGTRYFDEDEPEDLKAWDFYIDVDDGGMDGPYQPESRWGFRAMATFAEVGDITGLCPGCFPYDIEYDITVIALKEKEKDLG